MASAYSILHNYRQETYGPNLQLMGAALQYKQNALDTNRQRIRSVYNQLGFLDMAKEQDEEYAEKRLETAKGILNKYSALDLSRSSLTNDLVGKLSEVVDEPVKNAVLSTKLLRSEQAAWAKLREDSPELYNPTNQAYAMQNAGDWMDDGKVGTKYKGGGGVIEYQDLSKKIMDNLPELQKALKAEWVETVPGQGYFMALETREAVSRSDMEGAMNFLFDDKDRQQMGINAWGQFDQMPDTDLQEAYDGYFQPKIDNANQTLKDLKLARGKATTAAKKAEYDQLISQWEGNRDYLQGHTFSNVVSTKGRETAYQTLYNRQFKDNILDTYSYAPRTTKREIDAVSKENRYYELKLAEFDEKRRHNLASEANSAAKVPAGQGDPEQPFVKGEQVDVTPATTLDDFVANQYEIEDQAATDMSRLFTDNGLSESLLNSTEFKNQMNNLAGKEYITFKDDAGIEVKLSVADNLDLLQTYQNEVMTLSNAKKKAFDNIDKMLEGTGATLQAAHWTTMDLDISEELPNFNFRLVKGKDGNLEYKFLKHDGKTHNYAWMTSRTPETEAGKKTLQLYRGLHMMHDPSLSTSERRVMKDYVNNMLSELPPETAKHINTEIVSSKGSRMKNTHSTVPHVGDFWLSEFTSGDVEVLKSRNHPPVGISLKEFNNYRYVASNSDGLNYEIKDGFRGVNEGLRDVYSAKNEMLPESYQFTASHGTDEYEALKVKLGIPDPNYKMDISMRQQFTNGEPTGNMVLMYMVKNTDKETKMSTPYVYATPKIVKKSDLEQEGIAVFNTDRNSMYDARASTSASTMYLGNNTYDRSKVFNSFELKNRPSDYYVMTNEWANGTVAQVNEELGEEASKIISSQIKAFKRGEFDFNLVPKDGFYHMSVSNQNVDEEPFMMPLDIQTLDLETRKMYMDDPRQAIERVFIEYLADVRNKIEEDRL